MLYVAARLTNSDDHVRRTPFHGSPICEAGSTRRCPSCRARGELAKAIRCGLSRWPALTRYADRGDLEIDNNAAERAIRPIAIGSKNWLFAGSDTGGECAAVIYTLIETAKLNGLDPQVYIHDVLARIGDHPIDRIGDLAPWNWQTPREAVTLAA